MPPGDPVRIDFDTLKRQSFETIAADWGYVRDTTASTRKNPVLRAPGRPKLVLRCNDNGHWLYFNTTDPDDSGTIIDFLLQRGLSFADIRGRFGSIADDDFRRRWEYATPHRAPQWLVGRGIRPQTLDVYRPQIRCDDQQRVLFAHRDRHRCLTGFEIGPPDGVKRFATGGTRSLFALHTGSAKKIAVLVITEGAVNAISFAQLNGCPTDQAVLSTAGAPTPRQIQHISAATWALPNLETVILAQDHDTAGDRQAETIRQKLAPPPHITVKRQRPPENTDWNDLVNATEELQQPNPEPCNPDICPRPERSKPPGGAPEKTTKGPETAPQWGKNAVLTARPR